MNITRRQLRKIIESIVLEGQPFSGSAPMAGLFRQHQNPEEQKKGKLAPAFLARGDVEDDEFTEELIDYDQAEEYTDFDRQVMRSSPTRTYSIPSDAPNPYVPGETYADTTRRVTNIASDLEKRSSEISAAAAKKRREANLSFKKSFSGGGTGVMPFYSEESPSDSISSSYYDYDTDSSPEDATQTLDLGRQGVDRLPAEKTFRLDEIEQMTKSRGQLYREHYWGRY